VLIASPRLARHLTSGTSPAAALKAYRADTGKPARLATQPPGSVPNTVLQYWLWEQAKADPADVEIVTMGIDATQQAVLADAVEGAIVREPALTIIRRRNPDIKLVAVGDELFPGQPGTVVAASGAFLARAPEQIQGLVNALARAGRVLTETPAKVAPAVAAYLAKGIVDNDVIAEALSSPAARFVIDPRRLIEPAKALQAYQVKLGSLKEPVPLDELFDTRFIENAPRSG
jgi:NitT/TauT family transport system substrate-binding protein